MRHEFLKSWARFRPNDSPKLLDGDELLLQPTISKQFTVIHRSWSDLIKSSDFGNRDPRLHLSLIPQPFFGNIDSAPIVILTLNPGLNPIDYYGEYHVDKYRQALLANLRLGLKESRFPNLFLDPDFAWHSGFTYWHGRLAGLINDFAASTRLSRMDALSHFSRSVATIELVPYHSTSFGLTNRVMSGLRSVELARSFVNEILLPRARASEVLLVVARRSKEWNLRAGRGVIIYEGAETRAAYLTPYSRGGAAILKQLCSVWKKDS